MKKNILVVGIAAIVASACSGDAEKTISAKESSWHSMMAAHHSIETIGAVYFRMMDADQNGLVTRDERIKAPFRKWMVEFSQVDLDGDGKLTKAEYIRALKKSHARMAGQEV